jgi:transcriptional regulator GlxA family with amidase domain
VLTAAGVSAGVDMALHLAGVLGGAEVSARIRLALQYEPAPPSDAGAIRSAPAERVRRTAGMLLVNQDLPGALRVTPVGAALAFSWRLLRHRLSAGRAWIPGRPTG